MTDIVVIILIGQEKIHLKRCVEKLAPLNPRLTSFLYFMDGMEGRSSRRTSSRGRLSAEGTCRGVSASVGNSGLTS